MTNSPSDHHQHKTCSCIQSAPCTQSLDDMEFERGIWSAAQSGDLERLMKLARRGVDAVDRGGYTALHYAARSGRVDVCRQLLLMGAAVNVPTRAGQATPLHRAATAGHADVVKLLMDAGADVSMQDSDGQTPVHRAASCGNPQILRHLLRYNHGPLSVCDNRGQLPLHLAQKAPGAANPEVIKLLLG